jgi:hypothetical protein
VPLTAAHKGAAQMALESTDAMDFEIDCFCEVTFLTGAQGTACQTDTSEPPTLDGQPVDGACYIDATTSPALGNPALTEHCLTSERRLLRLAGAAQPQPDEKTGPRVFFIICEADVCDDTTSQ